MMQYSLGVLSQCLLTPEPPLPRSHSTHGHTRRSWRWFFQPHWAPWLQPHASDETHLSHLQTTRNPICFYPTVYKMELESNGHIKPTLLWLAVMMLACSLCFFGSHVPLCTLENAPAIRFQFDTNIVETNTDGRHLQSHSSGGIKFVVDSSRHRHFSQSKRISTAQVH